LGGSNVTKVFAGVGRKATFYTGKCVVGTVPRTPRGEGGVEYEMYVGGGILCERQKVALSSTADWSDHVFSEGYSLKPLEEVAIFIKKNKHLPGVSSANQLVKEGGIDVAKMLAKQMEKIEELTLYMIELNKKLK
jgi:hypothetical protein